MEPIIKLEHVDLHYDKGKPSHVWALKDISMEIKKGDYVSFFGPSGCGKTTLLYVVSGMEAARIENGNIWINGRDITQFSKDELAIFRQIGVGIVFQQFNLVPSITVLDNVALPMAFLGISLERRHEEALRLLDRLGISDIADRMPQELSGGQQQRVGIARALANNPPIIMCDEPVANLDVASANKVLEFLKELHEKDGKTVIMVTHEAWSLRDAQEIFYMKDGAVIKHEHRGPHRGTAEVSATLYGASPAHAAERTVGSNDALVRAIADMVMRGYPQKEVARFDFFLRQRLGGHIDDEVFRAVLDRPYRDGGVGLWQAKARMVTRMVDDIIANRRTMEQIHERLERYPEEPFAEEVRRLRIWMMEGYAKGSHGDMDARIDALIASRLRGELSPREFVETLTTAQRRSGVGLSMRTAERMAERLETALAGMEGQTG